MPHAPISPVIKSYVIPPLSGSARVKMSNKRTLSTAGNTAVDEDSPDVAGQGLTEGVFEKRAVTPEPGKKRKKIDPVRSNR